jgi:hypothetical protein
VTVNVGGGVVVIVTVDAVDAVTMPSVVVKVATAKNLVVVDELERTVSDYTLDRYMHAAEAPTVL